MELKSWESKYRRADDGFMGEWDAAHCYQRRCHICGVGDFGSGCKWCGRDYIICRKCFRQQRALLMKEIKQA
jgi:hypothetical protein